MTVFGLSKVLSQARVLRPFRIIVRVPWVKRNSRGERYLVTFSF